MTVTEETITTDLTGLTPAEIDHLWDEALKPVRKLEVRAAANRAQIEQLRKRRDEANLPGWVNGGRDPRDLS